MRVGNINQQSFGVSYSEIMLRTMNVAKQQKGVVKKAEPTLYAQLLMKDEYFLSDEVNDLLKANYFSYLINNIKK